MDVLQVALIFLIVLLATFLSILGVEAILILRDLRKDLKKLDIFMGELTEGAQEVTSVAGAVAEKLIAKGASRKPARKFFKKN